MALAPDGEEPVKATTAFERGIMSSSGCGRGCWTAVGVLAALSFA